MAFSGDQFPSKFIFERDPGQGVLEQLGIRNNAAPGLRRFDERLPNTTGNASVLPGEKTGSLRCVDNGSATKRSGPISLGLGRCARNQEPTPFV
jgi:hypothetical protein